MHVAFTLCVILWTTCVPGSQAAPYPLGLELQMVVNHVGAGNRTVVLWKNSQSLSLSPVPRLGVLILCLHSEALMLQVHITASGNLLPTEIPIHMGFQN